MDGCFGKMVSGNANTNIQEFSFFFICACDAAKPFQNKTVVWQVVHNNSDLVKNSKGIQKPFSISVDNS